MDDIPRPSRKVVSRAPGRTVRVLNLPGLFRAPIECESSLERDFVYRAALCPGITCVLHQPFQIKLASGRSYTPDFLTEHSTGGRTVVEVKLGTKVASLQSMFDDAAMQLHARGIRFVVLTEHAIREGKTHQRAAKVLRYRKSSICHEAHQRLIEALLQAPGGAAIGALAKRSAVTLEDVLHLLAVRQIVSSRLLPLDGSARVFHPNFRETHHENSVEGWFGVEAWPAHAGARARS